MNPFARMANYEELNIIGTGKHIANYVILHLFFVAILE